MNVLKTHFGNINKIDNQKIIKNESKL